MPVNLTEDNEFTTNVSIPLPLEPASIAVGGALRSGIQAITNRTRYLYNILANTGITKIRTVATSAAIKALTGMSDGDLAVISSAAATGLYRFRLGPTLPADVNRIGYNADNSTGFWENVGVVSLVTLGGVSGNEIQWNRNRIAVPNGIVSVDTTAETSPTNRDVTASGGWDDIGVTVSTSVALVVGDIVLVEADGSITNVSTNTYANMRIASVDPSLAVTAVSGSKRDVSIETAGRFVPVHCAGTFTAAVAGFHDFKIQVQGPSGETIRLRNDRLLRATVVRP